MFLRHGIASPEWSGPQTKAVTSHRTPKTPTRPTAIPPFTFVLIEQLEQMRRRELADLAADCGTHLGAVAPVHPTPYARVAFLVMDLFDTRVVANHAAVALERQRELIGVEPHGVERQRAGADGAVSRRIFGMRRRDNKRDPYWIRLGLGVAIGIAGTDCCDRAPEHIRRLGVPSGDQRIRHRSDANGLETSGG